jgi:phage host-nuclease inhibitor protein Gam
MGDEKVDNMSVPGNPVTNFDLEENMSEIQKAIFRELQAGGYGVWEAYHLVMDNVEPDALGGEGFIIDSREKANWVLKKLYKADEEMAEIERMIQKDLDPILKRAEELLAPIRKRREFFANRFAGELKTYTAEAIKDGKSKSQGLTWGKLGFRKKDGTVEFSDIGGEDFVIDLLEKFPFLVPKGGKLEEYIRIKKNVQKTPFKKNYQAILGNLGFAADMIHENQETSPGDEGHKTAAEILKGLMDDFTSCAEYIEAHDEFYIDVLKVPTEKKGEADAEG